MADRQTGRNSDQFNLRLPEGMRERIAEEARTSGRSMNAEIIELLTFAMQENPNSRAELLMSIREKDREIEHLRADNAFLLQTIDEKQSLLDEYKKVTRSAMLSNLNFWMLCDSWMEMILQSSDELSSPVKNICLEAQSSAKAAIERLSESDRKYDRMEKNKT